jgi:NAD(P)-dependent dehydrogenase (short-subunit alcohol dehydrogenase family)
VAFADEEADLAVTARSETALRGVVAEIEARGRRACPLAWDVSDTCQTEARLAEAWEGLGGLDILVNNAGVVRLPADHPDQSPEAAYDYLLDINLRGLYFLCRAAAERMKEQGHGVIVNLASDAGLRGAPHPYGISKWGVIGFTRGLAQELAPHGVRVNAIAPGPVATEMMNCQPGQPLESPGLPLGRYALPEEIASIAVFLASEDSRAVFGEAIVANSANS